MAADPTAFTKPNFDVNQFVKGALRSYDQSIELIVDKLAGLSDDASSKMKQAIFENYKLFIKAGKTASVLEATMHQIHSDFAEKQQIINTLSHMSLFNETLPERLRPSTSPPGVVIERANVDKKPAVQEVLGDPLNSIFSYIHGSSQALSDDLSRRVIFRSEVRELSVDTQALICIARLVLLNDLLIVAYPQRGRSDEPRFHIQALCSLDGIQLDTVMSKERRHLPPNAFKLTISKITRLFQADSAASKRQWIRMIEEAKLAHVSTTTAKQDSKPASSPVDSPLPASPSQSQSSPVSATPVPPFAIPPSRASVTAVQDTCKALSSTLPDCADLLTPPSSVEEDRNQERKNPFIDARDNSTESEKGISGWLRNMPEDLDVAISERDFTRATDLIIRARRTWDHQQASLPKTVGVKARHSKVYAESDTMASRIDQMEENLTEVLQQELVTAADRHGAPKSVASAILNLHRLGKSTLAAQLFLVYRSSLIVKALTRGIRQEGNQLHYLNRLSFTFHRHLAETAAEWRKSVVQPLVEQSRNQPDGLQIALQNEGGVRVFEQLLSVRFCGWVLEEVQKFGDQLRALVVDTRSITFCTLALVSQRVTAHAEKMTSILGIDILSTIHTRLIPTWKKAIETQSNILKDTAENRAKEETWQPVPVGQSREQEKELMELGLLKRPSSATAQITTGSFHFIRSLCGFVQSYRRLQCEELEPTMIRCVTAILHVELQNYKDSVKNPAFASQRPTVQANLEFFVQRAIPNWMKSLNGMRYSKTRQLIRAFKEIAAHDPAESEDTSANTSSL